jgi:hypothetical protein
LSGTSRCRTRSSTFQKALPSRLGENQRSFQDFGRRKRHDRAKRRNKKTLANLFVIIDHHSYTCTINLLYGKLIAPLKEIMSPIAWANTAPSGMITLVVDYSSDDEFENDVPGAFCFEVVHFEESELGQITDLQRRVRFSDVEFEIHEIPSWKDLSPKERKGTWYKNSEMKRGRKEEERIINRMRQGEIVSEEDEELCEASLERNMYALERTLHKLTAQAVVIEEQERQKEFDGALNPIVLAQKYRDFCYRCRHATFMATLSKREFCNAKGKHVSTLLELTETIEVSCALETSSE